MLAMQMDGGLRVVRVRLPLFATVTVLSKPKVKVRR